MQTLDLSTCAWTVRAHGDAAGVPDAVRGKVLPARIPGCIHTDLMRAEAIPDPRIGFNERDQQWIGRTDWVYECSFDLTTDHLNHERLDLACDGLDTIAELFLNDQPIGSAANQFHPHRFNLRSAARNGTNTLRILFRSPIKHIFAEQARLGARPVNGDWDPYIFIRKAACNFGWDWAPKVATCGVWKAIRVEAWSGVRIAEMRPLTRRNEQEWTVEVHVALEWSGSESIPEGLQLAACLYDLQDVKAWSWKHTAVARDQSHAVLHVPVKKPKLWWPRECGEQNLYDVKVSCISNQEGWGVAPHCKKRLGLREVRLNTDADEHGNKFQIEVNGRPIFCKGANWVPEGLFPDDRVPQIIRGRVGQAAAVNMNMLRVWGGGMYESDEFYDECDRLGIMVWQDFMFACACYPEEEPLRSQVETEARHQISRLSSHPSVVLWCGGNECVWGYESWGHATTDVEGPWKTRVGSRTWGRGYFFELLPRLVRELDPTRPYWPNSPFSGVEGENPNQESRGDRHTWDVSGEGLRTIVPRFCAEFGHQAPPSIATLLRVMSREDLASGSEALEHRQRATGGTERHIDAHLGAIADPGWIVGHGGRPLHTKLVTAEFARWHGLAVGRQALFLQIGIEHLAAQRPRCMGVLIWQFNDAWPSLSWSLVDSDGRPKPAYHAVGEAFEDIPP